MDRASRAVCGIALLGAAAMAADIASASTTRETSAGSANGTAAVKLEQLAANEAVRRAAPLARAVPHSFGHTPMLRPPRAFTPRLHVPHVHVPHGRAPRAFAPRLRPPRIPTPRLSPQRPALPVARAATPMHVRGVPPANLTAIRPPNFSPGVPTPQLRRGTPASTIGRVPLPNLPASHLAHAGVAHPLQTGAARPNQRPVTGLVNVNHRKVAVFRGQRYVQRSGRWHRLRSVSALSAAVAVVVVAGVNYFADGYIDLPAPACGGFTDDGCRLSMANVASDDGESIPQCMQYCPWDAAEQTAALAAPAVADPASAAVVEPVTRVGGDSGLGPRLAPVAPAAPAQDAAKIYAIRLQSAPDAGGKCVDVPNGKFNVGATLRAMPCNGAAAQTFAYDASKKSLAAGGFCVDAGSGAAPHSPLRLAACNGGPSQTWYIRQNGDYVEFVGIDGLCMEAVTAANTPESPLIAASCHGQASQSWTMHAAQPVTNQAAK